VNRPFDDQHQARVRLEAEAVLGLIQLSRTVIVKWTGSDVLDLESSRNARSQQAERPRGKSRKMVRGGDYAMNTVEPIDGGKATLAELRRAGIDALAKALGPVGMARFLQQFDPGQGDYTAERSRILGNPSVDAVMDEIERRRTGPEPK
jgi:hypothetical protein